MNKTTICSVVFLDIVEYSKKSVAEQIRLKNQFNAFISLAIKNLPITDRIILDTGDGAAISFLGDPEDALLVAMKLRDAVLSEQSFFLRIGINLGPVRLVQDINKQPNIVGDGINVAQRIMNFAQPNQILVSRSYFDVISCVTDEYANLFEYQGSRTDKHVREHELYAVKNEMGQQEAMKASFKHTQVESKRKVPWWSDRKILLQRVFPAATLLLILAAVLVKTSREPARSVQMPDAPRASAILSKSAPLPEITAAPEPVRAPAPPVEKKHTERKKEARRRKSAPDEISTLAFRIMPWGEVYVDGKKRGVSPPLKDLSLKSGKHVIEIKNTNLPSYSKTVETRPGESVIIEHQF